MSKLKILCIHATATAQGRKVTANEIKQWHLGPKDMSNGTVRYMGKTYSNRGELPRKSIGGKYIKDLKGNGWSRLGYTDMIHLDGSLENLTPYDQDDNVEAWELTYGAAGINGISRHLVYAGGKSKDYTEDIDTRTYQQKEAMMNYVRFMVLRHPNIKIAGHYQFTTKKECPCFNVPFWCKLIGIPEQNIYEPK